MHNLLSHPVHHQQLVPSSIVNMGRALHRCGIAPHATGGPVPGIRQPRCSLHGMQRASVVSLSVCLSVFLSFCLPVSYSRTLRLLFKGQEQDLLRIANMESAAITEVYSLDIPAGLFQFLIELSAIIAARPSPPALSIFCSEKIFTMRSE